MSKPLARLSALAFLLFTVAAHAVSDNQGSSKWFSAWTISIGHRMLSTLPPGNANYAPDLTGQTIRMIVRPSIAGDAVRVRIENTQATTPVTFSGAFIGRVASGAGVVAGTNVRLTFNGRPGLTLAAGAGGDGEGQGQSGSEGRRGEGRAQRQQTHGILRQEEGWRR